MQNFCWICEGKYINCNLPHVKDTTFKKYIFLACALERKIIGASAICSYIVGQTVKRGQIILQHTDRGRNTGKV
jgi:hypothetical protein